MKAAYLGPPGTFTEEAVILFDPNLDRLPAPNFAAAAAMVENGQADLAVLAIENSIEGSVPETLDYLIHTRKLKIWKEVVLPIDQCLLVMRSTSIKDIEVVFSHPNALGQCRQYIETRLSKPQVVASLSTVQAVADMKANPRPTAAIAPKRAAALYDVDILQERIQDHEGNATRFVVVASHDHEWTGDDKTSIAFSFAEDKPGQLYFALGEFSSRSINLAKLESRPSKESLGKYFFLMDVVGHRADPAVAAAFEAVQERTSLFKVFGSYPRYQGS